MADLAGAPQDLAVLVKKTTLIENEIDRLEKQLPDLKRFILPRGTESSCFLHIVRTVCRRAERNVVRFMDKKENKKPFLLQYLNRLSDLFFTLARYYNNQQEKII